MKVYLPPEKEHSLCEAISQDNVDEFSVLASHLKWGKPSWSASQLLLQGLGSNTERLWFWSEQLTSHEDPFTRRYASRILSRLWENNRNKPEEMLMNLADDEHWLVREDAHAVWSELLKSHFEQIYPVLQKMSTHSSANLRRCVAIAARSAGNLKKEEWAEPLIHLIEPLLSCKTAYVRKNLGPYALGDGLLRCYPDFTLDYLRTWATNPDEGTLWNVAMAFASYGGNKKWREGMEILEKLAADERRYVWRSVSSAVVYLGRRHPEVKDTLNRWLKDSERSKVAETALKYLTGEKKK